MLIELELVLNQRLGPCGQATHMQTIQGHPLGMTICSGRPPAFSPGRSKSFSVRSRCLLQRIPHCQVCMGQLFPKKRNWGGIIVNTTSPTLQATLVSRRKCNRRNAFSAETGQTAGACQLVAAARRGVCGEVLMWVSGQTIKPIFTYVPAPPFPRSVP